MRLAGVGDNVLDIYVDDGVASPGGNALNVAVLAARKGAQSAYIGALGNDEAGRRVLAALQAEGVDVSHVRVCDGANAFAVVRRIGGDRAFGRGERGVSPFAPTDDDLEYLAGFDVVHSSYASGLERWLPRIAATTRLSFDFGHFTDHEYIASVMPGCWFASFSGADRSAEEIDWIRREAHDAGVTYLLITRGGGAAELSAGGVIVEEPVPKLIEVVDTLGAGDSFTANLAVALAEANQPDETQLRAIMRESHRLSAEICSHFGAFGHVAGIPDMGTVDLTAR